MACFDVYLLGVLTAMRYLGYTWVRVRSHGSHTVGSLDSTREWSVHQRWYLCASCPDAEEIFFLAPQLLYFPREGPFHDRHFVTGVTVLNPSKMQSMFLAMDLRGSKSFQTWKNSGRFCNVAEKMLVLLDSEATKEDRHMNIALCSLG